ncbi:hypothetical protein QCD85_16125 [Paenibacillus sp. PsM32]|nr:hypothetical protein [Paenibacillus sp. PsM32]MDN4619637.1 hypothetical protein [Paenibacillus sp. PsM32]
MKWTKREIKRVFEDLGFERIFIKEATVFKSEKVHCKLTFSENEV